MNWKLGYSPQSGTVALTVSIETNGMPGEATFLWELSEAKKLSEQLRITIETVENQRAGLMQ